MPLTETPSNAMVIVRGGREDDIQELRVSAAAVGDGYFDTLRIPLVAGRAFTTTDMRDPPAVAVISRALEERVGPANQPLDGRSQWAIANQSIGRPVNRSNGQSQ